MRSKARAHAVVILSGASSFAREGAGGVEGLLNTGGAGWRMVAQGEFIEQAGLLRLRNRFVLRTDLAQDGGLLP
jgi:hypothetical protein